MRSSRAIALDILVARKQLQALQVEQIAARMAERDLIVNLAAQGKPLEAIARAVGMSRSATQGILWRAGRTASGKTRLRTPRIRSADVSAMLDANLSAALRHRAPAQQQSAGRAL